MAQLTLIDLARSTDPTGDAADMAEVLSQANEVYDDMVWQEGNQIDGHSFNLRVGIPAGTFRLLNQGLASSKSIYAAGQVKCAMLEAVSIIDKALMDRAKDPLKWRYIQDNGFIMGMSQTMAKYLFYGNVGTNPAAFTGLFPYYSTITTANSESAANTFSGGGSASNNASIAVVGWGPESIYGVFPRGTKAGLQVLPMDTTQLAYDANNNPYPAVTTWFKQEAGLAVQDWRWGGRIANLDVTTAGLAGNNPYDIFVGLSNLMLRLPKAGKAASGITSTDAPDESGRIPRVAIYCNRTIRGFMDIQAIRDKNVLIGLKDYAGAPTEYYRGFPIRVVDQLVSTESAIS